MGCRHIATSPALLLPSLLLLAGCGGSDQPPARRTIGLADALQGGDAAGFARALAPPQLEFPRDHGAHGEFRSEWWYWTANVAAADGRAFSVQLVFFRRALVPRAAVPARQAALAAHELVLAHAALGDIAGGRFHHAERLARHDGLRAGLTGPPLQLFCGDWSARTEDPDDGLLPLELAASVGEAAFALRLSPDKPLVLQGEQGLSRKGDEPGNASIYYSMPRLSVAGTVTVAGEVVPVSGAAWFDREWSTSALGSGQVGWDWFSLQFDDRTELMWYRLRQCDGSEDPHSQGLFVREDGSTDRLRSGEVRAEPLGRFASRDGGAVYPLPWRLRVPRLSLEIEVVPRLLDQELRGLVRYWEGAVSVVGRRAGRAVTGRGFLELTGYERN